MSTPPLNPVSADRAEKDKFTPELRILVGFAAFHGGDSAVGQIFCAEAARASAATEQRRR